MEQYEIFLEGLFFVKPLYVEIFQGLFQTGRSP